MATLTKSKPLSKSAQISASLHQMAREVGPDGKLPTYSTLLEMLGVSRTTLNVALDELENQRIIYRRHGVGIYAAAQQARTAVALVCNPLFLKGSTHSPFWDVLLREVRERAEADDLSCEIHFCKFTGPKEIPFSQNLRDALSQGHIQGVLGVGMNRGAAEWLHEKSISYVSFGGPGASYVGIDSASLVRQGVKALAESGCRRIAYLSPVAPYKLHTESDHPWEISVEVFRMALAHHGLDFDNRLVRVNDDLLLGTGGVTTLTYQEQGHRTALQVFSDAGIEPPDGILVKDDLMTLGVLSVLREMQLRPGQDIHIATHTNKGTSVLSPYHNVLHRLEVDPTEIVDAVFSTLLEEIRGEKPGRSRLVTIHQSEKTLIEPVYHAPAQRVNTAT